MERKPKLIICVMIFAVGGIFNLFFSTTLHRLLSREMARLAILPFGNCVASLFTNRQHLMLFLCSQGFILILALLFYLTNLRPYQSDLDTITPDIKTPKAVGQFQHGSARWLTDKEKDKAFGSFVLDPDNLQIKKLIQTGYDGLEFLKKKAAKAENFIACKESYSNSSKYRGS